MRISQIQETENRVSAICQTGLCRREIFNIPKKDLNGFELRTGQQIEAKVDGSLVISLFINQSQIFCLSKEEVERRKKPDKS